jgi:hypothetical protein
MQQPRLTTMMGVARALMAALDDNDVIEVLLAEFGWDPSFQMLALLRGADAARLFGLMWERLLTADLHRELRLT